MKKFELYLLQCKENNPELGIFVDTFMKLSAEEKEEIKCLVDELSSKFAKMGTLSAFELVSKIGLGFAEGKIK